MNTPSNVQDHHLEISQGRGSRRLVSGQGGCWAFRPLTLKGQKSRPLLGSLDWTSFPSSWFLDPLFSLESLFSLPWRWRQMPLRLLSRARYVKHSGSCVPGWEAALGLASFHLPLAPFNATKAFSNTPTNTLPLFLAYSHPMRRQALHSLRNNPDRFASIYYSHQWRFPDSHCTSFALFLWFIAPMSHKSSLATLPTLADLAFTRTSLLWSCFLSSNGLDHSLNLRKSYPWHRCIFYRASGGANHAANA